MASQIDYLYERDLCRRDEQALWCTQLNLELLHCIALSAGWYRGEKGVVTPNEFLSNLLRPGEDGCKRSAHRLMSLALSMRVEQPVDSPNYVLFVGTTRNVIEQLYAIEPLKELASLKAAFEDFCQYVGNNAGRRGNPEVFSRRVTNLMMHVLADWGEVANVFADIEYDILGMPAQDRDLRRIEKKIDISASVISKIERRTRNNPATLRARKWVLWVVEHYRRNPQLVLRDCTRKQVRLIDVWDVVQRQAADEYGIVTFKQFKTAYETGMRLERRTKRRNADAHF